MTPQKALANLEAEYEAIIAHYQRADAAAQEVLKAAKLVILAKEAVIEDGDKLAAAAVRAAFLAGVSVGLGIHK